MMDTLDELLKLLKSYQKLVPSKKAQRLEEEVKKLIAKTIKEQIL